MQTKIIHITSGDGPEECCRAVALVLEKLEKDAVKNHIELSPINSVASKMPNAFVSLTLRAKGTGLDAFLKDWLGTIQWISISPFRPTHKRKNWFVGVYAFDIPEKILWNEKDVHFETSRASGPGGQNVNKVETAVRAIHFPTKISVQVSEMRTQLENKKKSVERLKEKIEKINNQKDIDHEIVQWLSNKQLERGNAIRVFQEPLK